MGVIRRVQGSSCNQGCTCHQLMLRTRRASLIHGDNPALLLGAPRRLAPCSSPHCHARLKLQPSVRRPGSPHCHARLKQQPARKLFDGASTPGCVCLERRPRPTRRARRRSLRAHWSPPQTAATSSPQSRRTSSRCRQKLKRLRKMWRRNHSLLRQCRSCRRSKGSACTRSLTQFAGRSSRAPFRNTRTRRTSRSPTCRRRCLVPKGWLCTPTGPA